MKILMVSSYLPYPLFSGGHVRLFNILKNLVNKHEITLVCEKRDYQRDEDVAEVKKFCKEVFVFERKKQWTLKNILNTAFSRYPFLLIGHTNEKMKQKIQELLDSEKFDVIHVETFYVMQNLPKTDIPVVLTEHNIEYLVYERFAKTFSVVFRPLLSLDILKLKHWEKYFWKKATKVIAVSSQEKQLIGRKDVVVVQNGVDKDKFKVVSASWRTKFKEKKKILFIGDFKWIQNRDSAEWILKKIWPIVNSIIKDKGLDMDLSLWIVGRKIPENIKNINAENVLFDENASKDTLEIFKQADVLLAPIRVGGGTSFKILEAMAAGVPVVTTNLGIEGIAAVNGEEVMVSDKDQDLADFVVELLLSEKMYEKITKNARKLIEEKYDWCSIVGKLEEVYKEVINK